MSADNKKVVSNENLAAFAEALAAKVPLKSDIPTKVSDLQNDLGFTDKQGTITSVTLNGTTTSSGGVDLGYLVVQEGGKGLSSNDYTALEKTKLGGIDTGAQVNTIETVKVNGTALVPDANKAVNVQVPTTVAELSDASDYAKTSDLEDYVLITDLEDTEEVLAAAVNDLNNRLDGLVDQYPTENSTNAVSSGGVYEAITENELVTAASLSDLNARVSDLESIGTPEETDPVFSASPAAGITAANITSWNSKVDASEYEEDSEVVASALNDLNTRVSDVEDGLDNIVIPTKVSDLQNDSGFTSNTGTITGITMNGASKGTSGVVDLGTIVVSESDPVFSASVASGITSSDISNWNGKQSTLTFDSVPTENSTNPVTSGGLYSVIVENEEATAGAINSLSGRVSDLEVQTIPQNISDLNNDLRFTSNGNAKIFYGTCSTSGSNGPKQVTCSEFTSADLVSGVLIYVKFDNTNTASRTDLTMKVANTSYKAVRQTLNGGPGFLTSNDNIVANTTYLFQYDGTYWLYMNIDQVRSDWNATSGMGVILNKPDIPSESTVSGWGFTKNTGILTGVKFNNVDATVSNGVASITASIPDVANYFDEVAYDSQTKRINFKHGETVKKYIDATDFIKDGMVDSVEIATPESGDNAGVSCLVVTFNTDAGKEDIEIPLSSIFNPSNYYTKTETDSTFVKEADIDSVPTENSNNPVSSGGVYNTIAQSEYVISTSLNDLNTRVSDIEDELDNTTDLWEPGTGTGSMVSASSGGSANGIYSTVEGYLSETGGTYETNTISAGTVDQSAGSYAHAEGRATISNGGIGSHSEGNKTLASGKASHAEGNAVISSGQASHAEGNTTTARGGSSHAEGSDTTASGGSSHAEGSNTTASGSASHAEGGGTNANASHSHAEGSDTTASGNGSHAEGSDTTASGNGSHAEGQGTIASGNGSHAEGVGYNDIYTTAGADSAHAEGAGVVVKGQAAHGEGLLNVAGRTQEEAVAALADFHNLSGTTEQKVSKLIGFASHSEGSSTRALGTSSHAEGNSTQALVNATHAEGDSTTASGEAAHSEGYNTTASGNQAHAEGYHTEATANQAHAEGKYTEATSENAHAEGNHTTANGNASHTEGYYTVANNNVEHAEGQYNVSNKASTTFGNAGNTIHSVGIGTSNARKNAFEIMQNGDLYVTGVGSYDGTNYSSASTLQSVLSNIPAAVTESTVSGWGFTKNTGTLTGVSFNGVDATVTNGVASIAPYHIDLNGRYLYITLNGSCVLQIITTYHGQYENCSVIHLINVDVNGDNISVNPICLGGSDGSCFELYPFMYQNGQFSPVGINDGRSSGGDLILTIRIYNDEEDPNATKSADITVLGGTPPLSYTMSNTIIQEHDYRWVILSSSITRISYSATDHKLYCYNSDGSRTQVFTASSIVSDGGGLTGVSFNGNAATVTDGVASISATIPTIESLTTAEIDTIWNSAT